MKIIIGLSLLLVVFSPSLSFADDSFTLHAAYSTTFGFLTDTLLFYQAENLNLGQRILVSTVVGSLPGLVKEATDEKFCYGDYAVDIGGAAIGALIGETLWGYMSVSANGDQFFIRLHNKF